MKKSVLLVEADPAIQHVVKEALSEFMRIVCVETASEAEIELRKASHSLMILDVDLPDTNGIEFCQNLRSQEEFYDLPIFFLTNRSEINHKVKGFEAGADDYLIKPIDTLELKARILSYLRRRLNPYTQMRVDFYRIDMTQHRIFEAGEGGEEKDLELTPLEFKLFSHFLKNPGKIVPRSDLLKLFWGGSLHLSKNTLETHISSLRKKLGERGRLIKSIFKKGYCYSPKNLIQQNPLEDSNTKRPHAH